MLLDIIHKIFAIKKRTTSLLEISRKFLLDVEENNLMVNPWWVDQLHPKKGRNILI